MSIFKKSSAYSVTISFVFYYSVVMCYIDNFIVETAHVLRAAKLSDNLSEVWSVGGTRVPA